MPQPIGLDDVSVALDIAVDHRVPQTRLGGDIREVRVKRQPGGLAARHGLHAAAGHLAECAGGDQSEQFAARHAAVNGRSENQSRGGRACYRVDATFRVW